MLVKIAVHGTFFFMDKLKIKIHENWYSTNTDESKVAPMVFAYFT